MKNGIEELEEWGGGQGRGEKGKEIFKKLWYVHLTTPEDDYKYMHCKNKLKIKILKTNPSKAYAQA